MIVVGILGSGGDAVLEIAKRAAASGARTEVVGAAPAGPTGDRLLLWLATERVGHATVIRADTAPARRDRHEPVIESADLDLAVRYLPDVRVLVMVAPDPSLLATAGAASSFAGAALIVIGPVESAALDAIAGSNPIVLDPPAHDPDGAFAGLVAALAARLDAGEAPGAAWKGTVASLAVDRA